jgi:uncharacterized protein (TIGR03437 family)
MEKIRIASTLAFIVTAGFAHAGQYVISTFAGGAIPASPVDALTATIGFPSDMIRDSSGNLYFSSLNCVFRLDAKGVITRIAGTGAGAYSGDGGAAPNARLFGPEGLALDGAGNVYVADTSNNRIRRITPQGIIATVAGNGVPGYSGDGGPAASAQLSNPMGLAFDGAGNLYISEAARIRKVSTSGIITTFAGNGTPGFSGDNGAAINAQIRAGKGLAADASGNIYFSDMSDQRIRRIAGDGTIATIAGTVALAPGTSGGPSSGDGGPATEASLNLPSDVSVDNGGRIYISEPAAIRVIATDGTISSTPLPERDPFAAINTIATDTAGNIFAADVTLRIREISSAGAVTVLAGPGGTLYQQTNEPPTQAIFKGPQAVAVDSSGNVLIADTGSSLLWRVSPEGAITFIARSPNPTSVAVDDAGNYYLAGGAEVTSAHFTGPAPPAPVTVANVVFAPAVAVDRSGNVFVADMINHKILKVAPGGATTTYVGNGAAGFAGDGGLATAAQLASPQGLAVDRAGNLYIADPGSGRIRKVTMDGIITTVAGGGAATGDGVTATSAGLVPRAIAVDEAGDIFIADGFSLVQEVTTDGILHTIAGGDGHGYWGDGGPATAAGLSNAMGVAVDHAGNVYVAEQGNNIVRVLRPTNAPVLVSAVLDAATESAIPVTPGKIVVIYGGGLGPADLAINSPENAAFGPAVSGTSVTFNGLAAPMIYSSAGQAAAIVPYGVAGSASAQVVVTSSLGTSAPYTVQIAAAAPSFFSQNSTGAGQIAAVNLDGTLNDAAHPVKVGDFISLYATGEGQTYPAGVDGALAMSSVLPKPVLPVSVTVDGIAVTPKYAGAAPTEVSGLMQVVIAIPPNVKPGGYVPVAIKVGDGATTEGSAWIAVSQ